MVKPPHRETPDPHSFDDKTGPREEIDKLAAPIALDVPCPFISVIP